MIVGGFGALVVFIDYRPGRLNRAYLKLKELLKEDA